jgi:hypothetical protein
MTRRGDSALTVRDFRTNESISDVVCNQPKSCLRRYQESPSRTTRVAAFLPPPSQSIHESLLEPQ